MSKIELVSILAGYLNPSDELDRINAEFMVEDIINQVEDRGVCDAEMFIELSLMGIPFMEFLMQYKNISSEEAKALISYGYVTYDDFLKVLEFGVLS